MRVCVSQSEIRCNNNNNNNNTLSTSDGERKEFTLTLVTCGNLGSGASPLIKITA